MTIHQSLFRVLLISLMVQYYYLLRGHLCFSIQSYSHMILENSQYFSIHFGTHPASSVVPKLFCRTHILSAYLSIRTSTYNHSQVHTKYIYCTPIISSSTSFSMRRINGAEPLLICCLLLESHYPNKT
jgi:hypothetical protein